jgi:glycosyltransferase involved in cell wall biosynthesis
MPIRSLYWIDLNRFDSKPDKSTWLEMGHELGRLGLRTHIITSFARNPFTPSLHDVDVVSIRAVNVPAVFRIALLLKSLSYIIQRCDRSSVIVLPVGALLGVPMLKLFRFHNIHLDVRTVPVSVHGLKAYLDKLIYWDFPLRYLARYASTYSFITERLKVEVEQIARCSFSDSCIWSSGVKASFFTSNAGNSSSSISSSYNVFYHGTVTKDRGIFELVAAMGILHDRKINDVHLTIVGSGPDLPALSDLIRDMALARSVSIVGLVPYESVPSLIDKADCCISPLPPRPEWQVSSPLKVFEYMAMAKPIIATRIYPHMDVLESQDFVVWTEGHGATGFARAIEFASRNRARLAAAAQAGPGLVARYYDWGRIAKTFGNYLTDRYNTSS